MDNIWVALFIGAFVGAVAQMAIQTPWEDFIEKKFKQFLKIGIYKNSYLHQADFDELARLLQKAIKTYEFEYARILLDKMEWYIDVKSKKEKESAMQAAEKDFESDVDKIKKFKGRKEPSQYQEDKNKWVRKTKVSRTS